MAWSSDVHWSGSPESKEWKELVLASDFTTSSSTLGDIPGLTFTPQPGKIYRIEAHLIFQSANTGTSLQWCFTATGTVAYSALAIMSPNSINAIVLRNAQFGVAVAATSVTSTSFQYLANGDAIVISGATPSGVVKVQGASEDNTNQITVIAGSLLRYKAMN